MILNLQFTNDTSATEIRFRLRDTRIVHEWAEWIQEVPNPTDGIFEIYPDRDQNEQEELISEELFGLIGDKFPMPEGGLDETWLNRLSDYFPHAYKTIGKARFVLRRRKGIQDGIATYPEWIDWKFTSVDWKSKSIERDILIEDEKEFRLAPQYGMIYLANPDYPNVLDGVISHAKGHPQKRWTTDFRLWMAPSWPLTHERDTRSRVRSTLGRDIDFDLRLGYIPMGVLADNIPLVDLWDTLMKYPNRGYIGVE